MNSYTFMNLLKDSGYVPALQETSIADELENGLNNIATYFEKRATDHSFMGLLNDKGYSLNPIHVGVNDNHSLTQLAS